LEFDLASVVDLLRFRLTPFFEEGDLEGALEGPAITSTEGTRVFTTENDSGGALDELALASTEEANVFTAEGKEEALTGVSFGTVFASIKDDGGAETCDECEANWNDDGSR